MSSISIRRSSNGISPSNQETRLHLKQSLEIEQMMEQASHN